MSKDVSLRPCGAGSGRSRWRRSWLWLTVGIVVVGTLVFGAIRYGSERHPSAANSESLRSIALITTGQGASLDDLGLTAPQRVSLPPTSPLGPVGRVLPDPELFRPPGW